MDLLYGIRYLIKSNLPQPSADQLECERNTINHHETEKL